MPFRHGLEDGVALGAQGQAVGSVFHVTARVDGAIVRQDGRADREMGIRDIGVLHGFPGLAEQHCHVAAGLFFRIGLRRLRPGEQGFQERVLHVVGHMHLPAQISLGQVDLFQDLLFLGPHGLLVGRLLMVVAQQMEQAVDGQVGHFAVQAVAELPGLLLRHFRRNDDIAQQMFLRSADFRRFIRLVKGEGQDIRRTVHVAVVAVQLVDCRIIHQSDADFRLFRQPVHAGAGLQGFAQKGLRLLRHFHFILIVAVIDDHRYAPFSVSGRSLPSLARS